MALCPLTLNWNNDAKVFINPANVVAVYPSGEGTQIVTNAGTENGPHQIYVKEQPDVVAYELDLAARK